VRDRGLGWRIRCQCQAGGWPAYWTPGGATIVEWNFGQKMNKNPGPGTFFQDNFDISAVNGVNLTVDVQAVGGSNSDPGAGAGPFWLALNSPLSVHGADLRADCLPALTLKRSDLTGIPQPPSTKKSLGMS
jgi:hypothetical protein